MGIDYGMGLTNIDKTNGIRFGVISVNSLSEWFWDSVEQDYGKPTCPKCGNDDLREGDEIDDDDAEQGYKPYREHGCCGDYWCESCMIYFDGDDAYPDEPLGWTIDEDGIQGENCLDNDCCITKSLYYTYAPFCSPCVPGAGSLDGAAEEWEIDQDEKGEKHVRASGERTYCFDKSWFSEDRPCPYPYWSIETNELVYLPQRKEETLNDEVVGDSSKVLVEEPPAEIIEEVTRAYRGENGLELGGEG